MKTVILAGGFGSRLAEETEVRPKPMVEIGGKPILWHIMSIYATYGYKEFVVALGYKGDMIKHYFLNRYHLRNDLSIHMADGRVDVHDGRRDDWVIHLIDTGLHTQTGGRIKRLAWGREHQHSRTGGISSKTREAGDRHSGAPTVPVRRPQL
jgi:glucose-1-phosphate cytidylyltransferase